MSPKPVYHFIPQEEKFGNRVKVRLQECKAAILASAFFTFGAYQDLSEAIRVALERGAKLTFLLGRYDFVTEPRAVRKLLKLEETHPNLIKVYFDADFQFHFKLAVFANASKRTVIIGSSNLTPKGLDSIGETNLEIVNNRGVYHQAHEELGRRLKSAVYARECIDEYEQKYKRAQKYRRQRQKWHRGGVIQWQPKRVKRAVTAEPDNTRYVFCLINDHETDAKLQKNAERQHARSIAQGESFPYQWVHEWKSSYRRYSEGDLFVLRNDLTRTFGFAVCTKKFHILDSQDSREAIIFYRFHRDWNVRFANDSEYQEQVKLAGLDGLKLADTHISARRIKRLKHYLRKHQSLR